MTGHRLDEVALRSSSLRSLGACTNVFAIESNVFAIESFVDELAEAVDADPVAYRMDHLADPRGRAVLEAVADPGGLVVAAARRRHRGCRARRRGGAVKEGGWCAVVAEVEAVAEVRLRRLTLAEVGRVVEPDGVRNQVEGGAVQAASWTLKERVRFDRCWVTSTNWETQPVLRFSEVPEVDVVLLDRPDLPSVGSGEVAQGPTAAAIGNALAAAVGVRVCDLPITAEAVVAAVESAG